MLHIIAAFAVTIPTLSLPDLPQVVTEQDRRVHALLREAINRGADLYNRGDANGCYRLYEGVLIGIRGLSDQHPDWQEAIDQAFERAAAKPQVSQRAFALREAMNRIRQASSSQRE